MFSNDRHSPEQGQDPPAEQPASALAGPSWGGEAVFAVALVTIGAVFAIQSWQYGLTSENSPIGPGMAPFFLGVVLMVLGSTLCLEAIYNSRRERRQASAVTTHGEDAGAAARPVPEAAESRGSVDSSEQMSAVATAFAWFGRVRNDNILLRGLAILAILAVALLVAPIIGLVPALGLAILAVGRCIERLRWRSALLLGIGGTTFLWLVFVEFLEVNVPTGLF